MEEANGFQYDSTQITLIFHFNDHRLWLSTSSAVIPQ